MVNSGCSRTTAEWGELRAHGRTNWPLPHSSLSAVVGKSHHVTQRLDGLLLLMSNIGSYYFAQGSGCEVLWRARLCVSACLSMRISPELVSWSLTSPFSTNMAISKTKVQGWRAIPTQWRKASDILTSTLTVFLFSSYPKGNFYQFFCMLSMAMAQSSSGVVAIRNVLPVYLWISCFFYNGPHSSMNFTTKDLFRLKAVFAPSPCAVNARGTSNQIFQLEGISKYVSKSGWEPFSDLRA